jgi:hypothetical protein
MNVVLFNIMAYTGHRVGDTLGDVAGLARGGVAGDKEYWHVVQHFYSRPGP